MSGTTSDDCGCCGAAPVDSALTNRSGLSALAYRSGTQVTVLRRMLARLATVLPTLTTRDPEDPSVALLDAWATVADVVTFYQERIVNEGFLRTATERRSVLELARAIGYELRPGVAATTDLVFTVDAAPGAPTSAVVPERTKVLSVPGQGQRSQTFETSGALPALVELNEVGLPLRQPQGVRAGQKSLYLAGVTTGLRPGDAVLVVREVADAPVADRCREFRVLRAVDPQPSARPDQPSTTLVSWDEPLDEAPAGQATTVVHAFRLRASIFGQNAADWRSMPTIIRRRYALPGRQGDFVTWPRFGLPGANEPAVIDLDAAYPAVAPGSWLVLTQPGQAPAVYTVEDAELAAGADFGITARTTRVELDRVDGLAAFDRRQAVVHTQTEPLGLAEEPLPELVPAGKAVEVDGQPPLIERATVLVRGTTKADLPVVRRATVSEGPGVETTFAPALPELRRESVRILGNVVPATHGETVEDEVLGSGDGTATYQTFVLRKPDLTHVSAATTNGVASTLEVRVDGVLWAEVPSLFLAGPHDQVYVVRIDDESRATVLFGDGVRGSRLPTGQENVRARYRSGIGPDGDVAADALTLLPQRPLGIASVTNPLPAAGGLAPEGLDDARANAPLTVLTLDRVVSVRDHEDFARAFIGIGKARAVALRVRTSLLVHLTVATADGSAVDATTVGNLRDAITGFGGDADRLRIDSVDLQPFRVAAALLTDPARVRSDVEAAVEAAVRAAFGADRRSFGQPVSAAEVVTSIQSVPGVVAVVLTALHLAHEAPTVHEVLLARDAHFYPCPGARDRVCPAQLLLLDAAEIELEEMSP
ncbi:putative baseplate assembly protein [Geodermatophilus aquaeductus]|uniref:Putative baseplate assembly protein n=1 Tax=Geodermatophilus aquaeductus TaxID=1564161 RepID=A0A521DYM5_9ACTN|nr:putative baseplate assembly protein [Geodermatophilus aquaeductus]SMO76718.1 putative baseplate assembly protein [Geodermatophilus aquaeductus]